MFHEGDHGVPELAEVVGLAAVTLTVVGDFFTPPLAISLRFYVAARAPVPETAMYENSDSVVGEQEVGLAGKIGGSRRVPNAQLFRDRPYSSLGLCPFGRDATHSFRHLGGRSKRPTFAFHISHGRG